MITSERLHSGIEAWLEHEFLNTSMRAKNPYADFDAVVKGLKLTADNPKNVFASKAGSHANRYVMSGPWTTASITLRDNDYAAGRMIFADLKRLSGSRNLTALVHSRDQTSFNSFRTDRANYENTGMIICDEIAEILYGNEIAIEDIQQAHDSTQEVTRQVFSELSDQANNPTPKNRRIELAGMFERSVLSTFITHVAFYAEGRDNIAAIPALEPKSITLEPKVIYPFSDEYLTS